jgi:hypothetical protein
MKIKIIGESRVLAALTHATGMRIIRSTNRNRQHARTGNCGFVALGRGRGSLGCGGGASQDEDDNECANDMLHEIASLDVKYLKINSLSWNATN